MFDLPVRTVMKRRKLLKVPPQSGVARVVRLMAQKNVGAALVVEGARLVGIFTERDLVTRVVAPGLDARATKVAEVMTKAPQTVAPDKPFGYALLVMHEKGFRHLPVVDDDKLVGIVSARSAMDPELEEFVSEAHRREFLLAER